jgi:hypothetical protein
MAYYIHATSTGCHTAGVVFPAGKMSLYFVNGSLPPRGGQDKSEGI